MSTDLKSEITRDDLLGWLTKQENPTDENDIEQSDEDIVMQKLCLNVAKHYLEAERDNKVINLNLPLYTQVYIVAGVQSIETGNVDPDVNVSCKETGECFPSKCKLYGKECVEVPQLEIKIFTPNSVWFEYINNNYGKNVFDDNIEALKYAKEKYGTELCDRFHISEILNIDKD